jgi:DNA-binding transcriptional regulator GbsR (MarR family)
MQLLSGNQTINRTSIALLIEWWTRRKRLARSHSVASSPLMQDADSTYLEAYHRTMEVYAVVKAGGVQAQIEAAHAYFQREVQPLHQAIHALEAKGEKNISPSDLHPEHQRLTQEIQDLERSLNWRLSALKDIHPEEEKAVKQYLNEIEGILMHY